MKKKLYPTANPQERVSLLRSVADAVEKTEYQAQLTNQELEEKRLQLAAKGIKIMQINSERKEVMAQYREDLKPLKESQQQLLEELNTGTEKRKEMLYKVVDHAANKVGFYNGKGVLVITREIYPEERQTQIKVLDLSSSN